MAKVRKLKSVWAPQEGPQVDAITADWCPILLYGGAKFGGKSDFLLGDYLQDVPKYREHWQGILFRRSYKEFTELIRRSQQLYPKAGAIWKKGDSEWHFEEGAILRFRFLESLEDLQNYWGHSYPWIGVDELGDWEDENAFFRLFTLLRYGDAPIPTKRLRATANPGGPGHQIIKKYFINPAPRGYKLLHDEKLGMNRMFIPASLDDNKKGTENDPGYEKRMNRAGSEALVKAWRWGDWDQVAGQYFNELDREKHFIEPFQIPTHWSRFMAMDWGACGEGDPFSIGWWAVSDGVMSDGGQSPYPRNALVCYRSYYGQGLPKTTVSQVAPEIIRREDKDPQIFTRYAGGDILAERGNSGPSIMEEFGRYGIHFAKADQRRLAGAQQMRERLIGVSQRPLIYWFDTMEEEFSSLVNIQHDTKDPNDCAQYNDHFYEMCRYAIMSRPLVGDASPRKLTLEQKFKPPTLDELWQIREEMMSVNNRRLG